MLAYFGAAWIAPEPASAEASADYPEHIKLEQEMQLLERKKEVQKLKQELEEIRDSDVSSKITKFKEILELLETDKQIRDLLRKEPSLFDLYKSSVGSAAGSMTASDIYPDYSEGDSRSQFCGCLTSTRVKWLGKDGQAGEAILSLAGNDIDLEIGDKLGQSLCVLRNTSPTHATLECRDPIKDRSHLNHIALQTLPR